MEDGGGRSVRSRAAAAAAKKKDDANTSSREREQPRHAVPFAQIPGITDALREQLEAIGATEPSFMIGKPLVMSDVNRDQARLLFSCKRESPSQVTSVFTKTEMQFVEDKSFTVALRGLLVTAFDRAGRRYDLTCKYLESNSGYRFITRWKAYVEGNGLGVGMRVELWWFRSRKLNNRYELRQGEDGKTNKVPVMVESGDPDGSLGLVLLHYGNDLLEPEQAGDDEPDEALPVQEMENGMEPEQAAADEPDEAPPVQETETGHMKSKTTTTAEDKLVDDGGTCAQPIKFKTTTAEDKLADDGGECAEPMIRERNTEISREEVRNAAIGLLKLRGHLGGGGRDGGERGRGEPES